MYCLEVPTEEQRLVKNTYFIIYSIGKKGLCSLSQEMKDIVLMDSAVSSSGRCV